MICQSLTDSITFLRAQLKKLQQDIDEHIDRYPELKEDAKLLTSINGIDPKTSQQMLSVIHGHRFGSAERLAA